MGKLPIAFLAVLIAATAGSAQMPDLSMRTDLYVTNQNDRRIDLKNDPRAAGGQIVDIRTARAAGSTGDGAYSFFVGIEATREGGDMAKSVETGMTAKVTGSSYTDSRDTVFGPKEEVKEVLFLVLLKLGNNYVTIHIDPENHVTESNESNNTLAVNLRLTASPPIKKNKVDYTTTNILYLLRDKDFHPGKDIQVNLFEDRQLKPGQANVISLNDGMKGTCSFSKTDAAKASCTFHFGVIAKRAWQTVAAGPYTTIAIYVDNDPAATAVYDVKMGSYITDKDFVFYETLNAGEHTIRVVIDPLGKVDEKDENNNTFTVKFKFQTKP